ncbi:hypothetical protein CYMTET_51111 [Cymbomonas tetramitiformis]|uniref:Reverse transcriptase Ty1/copia-type domain-containing protein n=1 Tax=Cymbomonas tetramitiformis TaxID=36881 RepID=A0AAE0BLV4_9CHLO|nr:hypothetical protein CYMTET_51111 [Cymbomonas tetramitiformis]
MLAGGKPEVFTDLSACSFCEVDGEALVSAVAEFSELARTAGESTFNADTFTANKPVVSKTITHSPPASVESDEEWTVALDKHVYGFLGTGEFFPWAPVSFFLEQCVANLELLRKYLSEQAVNQFYPVFALAEVQLTSGAEWESAIVCTNARTEHRLPYQVLLLRHCGRAGKSVDVAETSIRFQMQHVALAAVVQNQWLPNGVTSPKNWPQLVNATDAEQWLASDKKEECALIDVKRAIVPVAKLPAGVKPLGMKVVYKLKFDAANVVTERKSRWVVFGNKQSHGVNYEEVYSPCTQLNTLRILLQLSLILGLLAFTMDVVTCFLNGELDVLLFVRWPGAWDILREAG